MWYLRRWLRYNKPKQQIYIDDSGSEWRFESGTEAGLCELRWCSTNDVWERHKFESPWGTRNGTIIDVYKSVQESPFLRRPIWEVARCVSFADTQSDHVARIALFIFSIRVGMQLPPVIVSAVGELLDGYHRLVAYHHAGISCIEVCVQPVADT